MSKGGKPWGFEASRKYTREREVKVAREKVEALLQEHPEALNSWMKIMKDADTGLSLPIEIPASLSAELDASLDVDITAMSGPEVPVELPAGSARPAAATSAVLGTTPVSGSKPVTIRIPNSTVQAFQSYARSKGLGYQTLINRVLKDARLAWEMERPRPISVEGREGL